jgi:amino acid adenylation domain-containing protein/non-ribosomal peptide synthase protein (TIGR01720 family)
MPADPARLEGLSPDEKRAVLAELLRERVATRPTAELPRIEPDPAARHDPFPLNPVQQAYFIGRSPALELGNTSAHFYLELDIDAALDHARLEQAFRALVERHEMLRAVIDPGGTQRVLADVPPFEIGALDLRASDETERAERLEAVREELSHQVFDPARWPLVELRTTGLPGERTRLHISCDLLVLDFQSFFGIVLPEWLTLYAEPSNELPPLALGFRDYVLAEAGLRDTDAYRAASEYWRARLDDLPPSPELPLRIAPAAVERPRFQRRQATLEPERWRALKRRASEAGLTPSTLLLTAFSELLAEYAARDSFTINLTLFNRLPVHPEVGAVVGDFTSLTLLEVEGAGRSSFGSRARAIKERLWRDLDHRLVSGLEVMRELARRSGRPGQAAMPVVFTSTLGHGEVELGAALPGRLAYAISQTPQVALDHQVVEHDGALLYSFDTVDELFPAGLLDHIFADYTGRLEALVESDWNTEAPPAPVARDLAARERANATETPLPEGRLDDGFWKAAAARPARIAVVTNERELRYGDLADRAGALAHALRGRGVRRGELVAIVMEKGWEQVVAALAILRAGAAYLPLDAALPAERLQQLLEHGQVAQVLSTSAHIERIDWPAGIQPIAVDRASSLASPPPSPRAAPDDLAYVIYTSGSTGQPKGVMIDHRSALNTVADVASRYGLNESDRVFAISSLSFDLSVFDVFGPLSIGAAIVIPGAEHQRDPAHWAVLAAHAGVTVWNSVPALMGLYASELEGAGRAPCPLRLALLSGDWIPLSLPDRIAALWPECRTVSLGGATEASIWSIAHEVEEVDPAWTSIPYGRPLANQRFHVLDSRLRHRPTYAAGELYIAGVGVALGYWRDPERTAQSFITHPETGERLYRTGDLGRYLPDGTIEFLGREDFQVKIGGHRIELGEIEAALSAHPDVATCAVEALGEQRGPKRLVGYVVSAAKAPLSGEELREHLARKLPDYMVPRIFVSLERLPLTQNGKLDRRALPAPEELSARRPYEPPRTDAERWVCSVLAELLEIERVGRLDNFFELGGDSLLAMELVARVRREFDKEIGLRELFDAATPAAITALIACSERKPAAELPPIEPDPTARHEPFPLNAVQQAYWVGRSPAFELGNTSAHFYLELDVNEELELDRFERAFNRVVLRHDMLRAVIGRNASQRVLAEVPEYRIAVEDLRTAADDERGSRLLAIREELSHEIFDTECWPLFELRVTRLPGARTRLHISCDLLIVDFQSFFEVLLAEWLMLYRDPAVELPPLELRFRDYVLAEASLRDSEAFGEAQAYWAQRLSDLAPAPELPLAKLPCQVEAPRFVRRQAELPPAQWTELKGRAKALGVTPSAVLLAAFSELLAGYAKSSSFTINLTLFNRLPLHREVGQILGDFTSLTLLEVEDAARGCFAERVRAVQQRLWDDLDHRLVSGVEVMRELARQRRAAGRAVMPVVFTSTLGHGEVSLHQAIDGELSYCVTQTPQVWLDHQVFERDGALLLSWDAVDELFPPHLLDEMFAAYETLLGRLTEGARDWGVQRAEIGLGDEDLELRAQVNATDAPPPEGLIHDRFFELARDVPDRPAVVTSRGETSYGTLAEHALAIAGELRGRGARPGRLVAVACERGVEQIAAVLGIVRSGAAYLPLDPTLPPARLESLLRHGEVELVVTERRLAEELEWPDDIELVIAEDAAPCRDELASAARPDDLAYVIYTSGSTGQPKGVMIDHRGALNTVADVASRYGFDESDRVFAVSSLSFDLSVFDVFGPLSVGGALVLPDNDRALDPRHWLELSRSAGVSVWNSVPALMQLLVGEAEVQPEGIPPRLRLALLSGDWIPLSLPDRIRALAPDVRVVSLGGATEASIWSIAYEVGEIDPAWTSIPYGRPLANQRFHVLDGALRPRPTWAVGELYIAGVGLALGYWRDPERSDQSFITHCETGERLYRTGDLGRYLPDGTIEFLGREDFQVKIGGHRIELGEIEVALSAHPDVGESAVCALGETRGRKRLVAYVVPRRSDLADRELRVHLAETLPEYMVPRAVVFLDALPLTRNGKLDRAALPAPEELWGEREYQAPRNDAERALCETLANLLDLERVGVQDDFFELGGDSILAMELISRVGHSLGVVLTLQDLVDAPTLGALAEVIEGSSAAARVPVDLPRVEPDPAARHEPFPLNPVQQAYWIGRSPALELGNTSAHFYLELDIDAPLDRPRLERAFRTLIERHEMLRAVIAPDGTQRVLAEVPPFEIGAMDVRLCAAAGRELRLEAVREELSHQVFDPSRWPLIDIRTSDLPGERTRLHISCDLLVLDFQSFFGIVLPEWLALYAEPDTELPGLTLGFRDYVLGEAALRDTDAYRTAAAYWSDRIEELPPAPDLPLRISPAAVERPRFERHQSTLDRDRWRTLKRRATQAGVTPSALVLAVFSEVLADYAAKDSFTINLTLFNRLPLHPEVGSIVGDFTSLTLLGVENAGHGTFQSRVRALQQRLWRDLDHRLVSGLEVMRGIAARERRHAGATMPVVFTSTLGHGEVGGHTALPGRLAYAISQTPQVALDHQVVEHDGALLYSFDTVAELFPDGLLDRMFTDYSARLDALAEADWESEAHGSLAPAELVARNNANATETQLPEGRLDDGFWQQAASRPGRVAVVTEGREITYGELAGRAAALARALMSRGVRRGELVAIVMEKGFEQVVAALAILRAGAAYLPLDAALPAERLEQLLTHGEVTQALTTSEHIERIVWPDGTEPIAVDRAAAAGSPPAPRAQPDDLAYVIYTSGSTGQPKGVAIDHRGALNTVADICARYELAESDRVFAISSLSFDLSVFDVFGPLSVGAAVVIPSRQHQRDPAHWADLAHNAKVTVWNSVPALMTLYASELEGAGRPRCPLRLALLSGDWIPLSLPDRIASLWPDCRTVSLGGATEASIWSIAYEVEEIDPEWTSIPYGRPLANQRFRILDPRLRHRPTYAVGELYIAGVGLARGYWRDPERTAQSFITHPDTGERLYRTGDLGRYLPDGTIEFLGREDFQVKIGGHRIELGEIEAALATHPGVEACVVEALGERRGPKRLVGYVVSAEESPAATDELREHLARKLPDYMLPQLFLTLDCLPLTQNGKLDRRALPAPEQLSAARHYEAPRTDAERRLCSLLAELLEHEQVGRSDNFFELGGDSLVAMELVGRARREGLRLDFADLVDHPDIAALAERAAEGYPLAVEHEPVTGPVPLGPVQRWFLHDELSDPESWSLTVVLEAGEPLDHDALQEALQHLIAYHDALRLRFHRQEGVPGRPTWRQVNAPPDERVALHRVDLSDEPEPSKQRAIAGLVGQLRSRLRIGTGPLMQAAAVKLGRGRPDQVVLVLHHLAVDGASLRILLDDLHLIYRQVAAGGDVRLPPKGTSYQRWATETERYAQSPGLIAQLPFWLERLPARPAAIPLDHPEGRNDEASARTVAVSLTEEETARLLRDVVAARGVTVDAVLAAALAQALHHWSGDETPVIDIVTHGRQPIAGDVDVWHTVGWFSTTFPLTVHVPHGQDLLETLDVAGRGLAEVPDGGVGYAVLRQITRDGAQGEELRARPHPLVGLNHVGRMEGLESPGSTFALAPFNDELFGVTPVRVHAIDVIARVSSGMLRFDWIYSSGLHERATIARVAEDCLHQLRRLAWEGSEFTVGDQAAGELDAVEDVR